MFTDPLSDALAVADARGVFSGGFTAGGRWAVRLRGRDKLKVNVLARGGCLLVAEGGAEPVALSEGDIVVSDGRRPYVLCSEPGLEPVDPAEVAVDPRTRMGALGGGEEVVCVSGHIDLSRDSGDLLRRALPELIHVRSGAAEAPVLRWLTAQLMREMADGRAGSAFSSDHLAQLMFLQVLRACLSEAAALPAGWLRALADERLAPALRLMHADPAHPWRLEELARAAAMSRTTFAVRFKEAAGVPPLTYLQNWRMSLAARALRQDSTPVAALARSVGYTSESAFSNAFKRTVGVAPRRYRETVRS
ncbi:AraC-like DNA-binding protein [Streptomyces griseochromogenes]|uniref:AraC family transcriptional regulator n=1 Tax=Streptomyces griseochromogenes TaxID=68214 RepID=A0A1B1B1V0_9ACTN|nr:AraC family transcriptional regulator [Streptomyces griseochromogenes]ANP52784.1 AraC family transcriptional regulator [Streptomyces griseochromogenes]MBP2047399.1 AraC-like DNA-binding protein [Streptomyces griseochromogenes]